MISNNLPSIYEHAKRFGIIARKSLGQNFLFDENINDKIVRLSGNIEGQNVIEIGPGPGGLTRSILKSNPKKLIVIEKDKRCIELLKEIQEMYPQLEIISDDALKISINELSSKFDNIESKVKIISNLPYNIGTVLLFNWLDEINYITDLTLMFQREVADRICAKENTNAYGKLSIMVQLLAKAEKVMDLSPKAFTPAPKVSSAIVKVTPLNNQPQKELVETIKKLVDAGFAGRRKMINKSLNPVIKTQEIYSKAGIKPTLRAENLSLEDYKTLAEIIINSQ
ncbi:MAG: rRNA ((1518)-N(6)/adenine(1519)-N(6))-dimethyltransferase [Rickettsiaceae bacterium]|jgi:16S rRNA (adenine1518-N6/adenine1519-N6)-dimethyltransferase|nr:rRNA ((1518)-N(6)/adenine(1519)-N(6))-dimethyltransferase [Rickettsiaceae bacterium]